MDWDNQTNPPKSTKSLDKLRAQGRGRMMWQCDVAVRQLSVAVHTATTILLAWQYRGRLSCHIDLAGVAVPWQLKLPRVAAQTATCGSSNCHGPTTMSATSMWTLWIPPCHQLICPLLTKLKSNSKILEAGSQGKPLYRREMTVGYIEWKICYI